MPRLGKGQIDRLGERLRHDGVVSDSDLAELQRLRAEYDDALAGILAVLAQLQPPFHATSRLKTVQTIIEKLRREDGMRLSRMQDVGGARIIVADRDEQDKAVESIVHAFPEKRIKDRRKAPSFGYRAVHVTVKHLGCWIEIQVRTAFQDRWAQTVERLADLWGRQIRYGEKPNEPVREAREGLTRAQTVELLLEVSDSIAGLEESRQEGTRRAAESTRLRADAARLRARIHSLNEPALTGECATCASVPIHQEVEALERRFEALVAETEEEERTSVERETKMMDLYKRARISNLEP